VGGGVAVITATAGLSAFAAGAHATSSFTYSRVAGTDRYGTAAAIAAQAFNPNGTGTVANVLIANGLPGHQSDALAAPYLESSLGAPILFVDGSSTIPANTQTALTQDKVTGAYIIGGTNSVTSAEVAALQNDGITIKGTYAGTDRFATDQAVNSASGTTVGTVNGLKTAILASGDDNHLVDALSAGGLSYADHLPIILTESSSSTLPASAAQQIQSLGIQQLIVVGGNASVPTTQYTPAPSGVTKVDTAATTGADRSATAALLAADEVANYGFSNASEGLATGATYIGNSTSVQNDGADALASAPLQGMKKWPLLVTINPTTLGSVATYNTNNASTLTTPGYAYGGTAALPDATLSAAATDAGGSYPKSAGTPAVTSLPQLVSASIVGTTQPNQVTASTPAGTTVSYTFSQPVVTASNANFKLYPYSGGAPQVASQVLSVSGSTVTVLFSGITYGSSSAAGSNATATNVATNYTLAAVASSAVTTTSGTTNPAGSAPVGSGQTSTTQYAAGTTSAPDLTGVTFGQTTSVGTETPVTFTFDKNAYITAAAAGTAASTTAAPTTAAVAGGNGQTAGFYLVFPDNTEDTCNTPPATGANPAGGTTTGGGAGTTTITVLCGNIGGSGTLLTSASAARAYVGPNTVTSAAQETVTAPATGGCTGGQYGSTSGVVFTAQSPANYCNPLEAYHFPSGTPAQFTVAPDLTSVTTELAGTAANTSTKADAVLYTFDQPVTAATAQDFGVFNSSALETPGTQGNAATCVPGTSSYAGGNATSGCTIGGTNNNEVLVYFPAGTVSGTGAGATGPAVGAYVVQGGAAGATSGASTPVNQADELSVTPSNSNVSVSPGVVLAPQLQAVHIGSTTNAFGVVSYAAQYVFDYAVTGPTSADFHLYNKDGSSFSGQTCTVDSTNDYQVDCVFTTNPSGYTSISGAVLGTVDYGAVTGNTAGATKPAPNSNSNPEGASNVS
jgi:putative cell wall-binding protein